MRVVDDVAVTAELRALCTEWRALQRMLTDRLTVERTPEGNRPTGMAICGSQMARTVLREAVVPPGDSNTRYEHAGPERVDHLGPRGIGRRFALEPGLASDDGDAPLRCQLGRDGLEHVARHGLLIPASMSGP